MGKKTIQCPICLQPGVLVKEPPRMQKRTTQTNWELWREYKTKYPNLADYDLRLKIIREKRSLKNIPTKAYYRKKNPFYRVYHFKKVNGKWKTNKPCYLGVINLKELDNLSKENPELIEPNLSKQLKEFIKDKDKKTHDTQQINKLLTQIFSLKNQIPIITKKLMNELNKKQKCPVCNNPINLRFYKIREYDGSTDYRFEISGSKLT